MKLTIIQNELGERVRTESGAEVASLSTDRPGIVLIGQTAISKRFLQALLPLLDAYVKTGSFEVK